jgi:hypothetical protein
VRGADAREGAEEICPQVAMGGRNLANDAPACPAASRLKGASPGGAGLPKAKLVPTFYDAVSRHNLLRHKAFRQRH